VINRNISDGINSELQIVHVSFLKFLSVFFKLRALPLGEFSFTRVEKTFLILPLIFLLQIDTLGSLAQSSNTTTDQLLERGESLYTQGDLDDAIRYYNEVLTIEPNNTGAIYDKGLALDVLGKYEDAMVHYDMLLSVEPDNINALVNKGAALADLGNYQESIEYFDKVLSIDPNNVLAAENKKLATSVMNNSTTTS
jgi:tetratricopeptide (TPR) repeat protein